MAGGAIRGKSLTCASKRFSKTIYIYDITQLLYIIKNEDNYNNIILIYSVNTLFEGFIL
jgi:hypothetical protein